MIIEKASFSDQASLYDRLNQEKKTNVSVDLIKMRQNFYEKNCITLEIFSIKITD